MELHAYIPFDIFWVAWSCFSACFPVLWIHYKDTKENNFIGKKNTGLHGKCREDKDVWERPWYYQRVLFISSFWKRVKLGHSFIILCQSWQLWQWFPAVIKSQQLSILHSTLAHSASNQNPQKEGVAFDHKSFRRCMKHLCEHFSSLMSVQTHLTHRSRNM